jgi:hypothetical protein
MARLLQRISALFPPDIMLQSSINVMLQSSINMHALQQARAGS